MASINVPYFYESDAIVEKAKVCMDVSTIGTESK